MDGVDDDVVDDDYDDRDAAIEVQTNYSLTKCFIHRANHERVAIVFRMIFKYFSNIFLLSWCGMVSCCGTSVRGGEGMPPLPVAAPVGKRSRHSHTETQFMQAKRCRHSRCESIRLCS